MNPLHELTEIEAFDRLILVAVSLWRGDDIPKDHAQWVASGLLAMGRGETFNGAFAVKNVKAPSEHTHALRYALVERLRKQKGISKAQAINVVADMEHRSVETISSSWKLQEKLQKELQSKIRKPL